MTIEGHRCRGSDYATAPSSTVTTVPTSSHVGATLSLQNTPYSAALTLARVIDDPAVTPAPGPGGPAHASTDLHFVALQLGVVNTGGTALIDNGQEHGTNLTPLVVTADDRSFPAVSADMTGCRPVFGLQLEPGGSATACSVFQLPVGDEPVFASVQMVTGYGDETVNWRIP